MVDRQTKVVIQMSMMVFKITLIFISLIALTFQGPLGLAYPTNIEAVEEIFREIPEEAQASGIVEFLKERRDSIQAEIDSDGAESSSQEGSSSRSRSDNNDKKEQFLIGLVLLDRYIEISNVKESKCGIEQAAYLVSMVEFHSKKDQHKLEEYLLHYVSEQFIFCRRIWYHKFVDKIKELDQTDWKRAKGLLDDMMAIKMKNSRSFEQHPYSRESLRDVVDQPPAGAIVLFMVRHKAPMSVDENMKEEWCSMRRFEILYRVYVVKMCERVCETLSPATEIYKYPFDPLLASHFKQIWSDDDVFEWLAIKSIACKIAETHNSKLNGGQDPLLAAAFAELTSSPEEYYFDQATEDKIHLEHFKTEDDE